MSVDPQEVLVSLVYDRGPGFGVPVEPSWENRREMRAIRDEVAKPRPSLSIIAALLRAMKRLWMGKISTGYLHAGRRGRWSSQMVDDKPSSA